MNNEVGRVRDESGDFAEKREMRIAKRIRPYHQKLCTHDKNWQRSLENHNGIRLRNFCSLCVCVCVCV